MDLDRLFSIIIILSFVLMGIIPAVSHGQNQATTSTFDDKLSQSDQNYTSHETIIINDNNELEQKAQSEGWPGDGSKSDPYVIEGYDINGTGEGICIYMQYVDKHFTIKNCYFHDASGIDYVGHGTPPNPQVKGNTAIHLWEVSNGNIEDNTIRSNEDYGIRLSESNNISITDNDISSSCEGVRIRESTNNVIKNNTINSNSNEGLRFCLNSNNNTAKDNVVSNNGYHGIWNDMSDFNVISNNIIESNERDGIHLSFCDRIQIRDNKICENEGSGINFDSTSSNVLSENMLINDGLNIEDDFYSHDIGKTNTVNGKPIYYWKNRYDEVLTEDAGQVILADCKNISIEGQNLTGGSTGITIVDSENITIKNSKISLNDEDGIYIKNSENNTVCNNEISSNERYGISSVETDGNTISSNAISDNYAGIYLSYSKNHVIDKNSMKDNGIDISGDEIKHWETHHISSSNTINGDPIIFWKDKDGEELPEDVGQVILVNCHEITVENQIFQGSGIRIFASDNIDIKNNIIKRGGISIESSNNITISNNRITDGNNGITLIESKDIRVIDNDLISNGYNIYVCDSKDSIFKGNYVFNGTVGMFFRDDYHEYSVRNTVIVKNNISHNDYGLYLTVYRDYPGNNLVYHNNFIDNKDQSKWDGYGDSKFYNTSLKEGNYWSDYNGTDSDGDGIGDTPYTKIAYGSEEGDKYPLMNPVKIDDVKADAGQDRTVEVNGDIILDGSNSSSSTEIVNYTWSVNGEELYGMKVDHKFDKTGDHTVLLTVRSKAGDKDTDMVKITVKDWIDPTADFTMDGELVVKNNITFNASKSTDNTEIQTYEWEFDDSNRTEGVEVTHSFEETGDHTITLRVTDENGNSDIYERTINVEKNDHDDKDDNEVPGFTLITLIAGLVIVLFYIHIQKSG